MSFQLSSIPYHIYRQTQCYGVLIQVTFNYQVHRDHQLNRSCKPRADSLQKGIFRSCRGSHWIKYNNLGYICSVMKNTYDMRQRCKGEDSHHLCVINTKRLLYKYSISNIAPYKHNYFQQNQMKLATISDIITQLAHNWNLPVFVYMNRVCHPSQ